MSKCVPDVYNESLQINWYRLGINKKRLTCEQNPDQGT